MNTASGGILSSDRRHALRGITLIELFIVISVISLLLGFLLVAVSAARDAARRSACQSNLRQLSLAMILDIDSNNRLPENRFTLDFQNNLVKESMWKVSVLAQIQPSLPINQASPPILICPNGLGVKRFFGLPTFLNVQPIETNFSESTDYAGNAGLMSARNPGGEREKSLYRGGLVADVFAKHVTRRPNMLRGGRTHTLAYWESLGRSFLQVHPEIGRLSAQEFDSGAPFNAYITSDLDPEQTVPILNAPTFVRYHATLAGRQSGYLTYFDQNLESLRDYSPMFLSTKIANLSNRYRGPFSLHQGVVPVSFIDGSTRLLSENTESQIWFNLSTIQDDLPISLEE